MALTQEQLDSTQESRNDHFSTRRATVPALDEILYQPLPVLDHGFVRVIDYMGDDSAIVQAARVSYGKGTKKIQEDRGLIHYLMRHYHTTPFEMCEIKFHVKLPLFIARQWIRHRTASVNEYSLRYSIAPNEFYIPAVEHLGIQAKINRQGRGESLSFEESQHVLKLLQEDSLRACEHYQEMINMNEQGQVLNPERSGLARELARLTITLNHYTEWYWKIDLHNLFHFLKLRADPHAQYEIRAYAEIILEIVKKWVPLAYGAFIEYRQESGHFSKSALNILRQHLQGHKITQSESGLSGSEWKEMETILGFSLNSKI